MNPKLQSARREFKRRLLLGFGDGVISVTCVHCSRAIKGDTPWRCGSCGYENRRTAVFSFLNRCQSCGAEPAAIVCPHSGCGEVNAIAEGQGSASVARLFSEAKARAPRRTSVTTSPQKTPEEREVEEHQARKKQLEREVELAELRAKLREIRETGKLREQREESGREKMKARIRGYIDHFLDGKLAARDVEREISKEFKDEPEFLKDSRDALQDFINEEYRRKGG